MVPPRSFYLLLSRIALHESGSVAEWSTDQFRRIVGSVEALFLFRRCEFLIVTGLEVKECLRNDRNVERMPNL